MSTGVGDELLVDLLVALPARRSVSVKTLTETPSRALWSSMAVPSVGSSASMNNVQRLPTTCVKLRESRPIFLQSASFPVGPGRRENREFTTEMAVHRRPPDESDRQAFWAAGNRGELRSIPLRLNPSWSGLTIGSGKPGSPWERMHLAYFRSLVVSAAR